MTKFKCYTNKIVLFLCTLIYTCAQAQIGALGTFDFLNSSHSARTTALGSYNINIADDDIAQGYSNPALLNDSMHNILSVNHNFHLADISFGFIAFGHHMKKADLSVMAAISYINYGDFVRSDRFGNIQGSFNGKENAIIVGLSKALDERLTAGINLKYVQSTLDSYQSNGVGFDLGFYYQSRDRRSSWALLFKNSGWQFTSYNIQKEAFPFDLQVGFSKRLAHLPFRFNITAHHLQQWNLRNTESNVDDPILIGGNPSEPNSFSKGVDNFFRHLVFGGEFLIGKNEIITLRLGYNHLRNKELTVSGFRSLSGFSFGFGVKVRKLKFDYGLGKFHLAGGMNHLSLTMDLNSIFSKL